MSHRALSVVAIALSFAGVAAVSPTALILVVSDGLLAASVMAVAVLLGLGLSVLFPIGPAAMRWHLLTGAMLGLGLLPSLVLGLGLAGALQRGVWGVILAASATAGALRLLALLRGTGQLLPEVNYGSPACSQAGNDPLLWLLTVPFVVLALLAASTAPGLIWSEEGFGYDVLEYHLQLPREYLQSGQIAYLPHNVYANFPANVEMLYLLVMLVAGETHDVAVAGNMIHLLFGALFVFAAWVAGREWSPRAGVVCGVAAGTTGWLPYLSGLAYVEHGMLFFGMAATAILTGPFLRVPSPCETPVGSAASTDTCAGSPQGATDSPAGSRRPMWTGAGTCEAGSPAGQTPRQRLWLCLAGLAAGFACGCKYTALPMVALPLALSPLFLTATVCRACRPAGRRRLSDASVFLAAMLVAFGPWLAKNFAMTGNPVFPLANSVFRSNPPGWGDEQTEHWNRSHRLADEEQTLRRRVRLLWNHIVADPIQRFGPALFLLALLGLCLRPIERVDVFLCFLALAQFLTWFFATHLFARFAVVLLIPLALLAGRATLGPAPAIHRALIPGILVAGAAWNFVFSARLHAREPAGGIPPAAMYEGHVPQYAFLKVVNEELPPDARVLLVGDARAFYFDRSVDYRVTFNRNPFFELLLRTADPEAVLGWLRERGYSHVLVHWGEVRRLSRTYGFSPPIDEETLRTWLGRLAPFGVTGTHRFMHPSSAVLLAELFTVRPGPG